MSPAAVEADALPLSTARAKEATGWIRAAIQGMGMAVKEARLNLCSHLRMEEMPGDIRLDHELLCGSTDEAKRHVEERVRVGLNDLIHGLQERGADPTFGVRMMGSSDLKADLGAGWNRNLGRYAVWIKWLGPVPATWPHKITPEDVPGGLKDDDAGYIRDYRSKNPEGWDEALKVLAGGRALDNAAREAANGPRLPDVRTTA